MTGGVGEGLLTIGPRFGGALDESAEQFMAAVDAAQRCECRCCLLLLCCRLKPSTDVCVAPMVRARSPKDFVASMRAQNKLIMGIGHVYAARRGGGR